MQQQLTIEMIEGKDFKVRTRGYDQKEVDTFLDEVCDEMERQLNMIAQLQQDVIQLQHENDLLKNRETPMPAYEEPPVRRGPTPESVQAVFDEAVRFKDQSIRETEQRTKEMIEAAQNKAAEIVANAERTAEDRLTTIREEHDRLAQQVEALRQAAAEYRDSFFRLMEQQKEALEKAAELFE